MAARGFLKAPPGFHRICRNGEFPTINSGLHSHHADPRSENLRFKQSFVLLTQTFLHQSTIRLENRDFCAAPVVSPLAAACASTSRTKKDELFSFPIHCTYFARRRHESSCRKKNVTSFLVATCRLRFVAGRLHFSIMDIGPPFVRQ